MPEAAVPIVGSVVGGLISADASSSAADAQTAAAQQAANTQLSMFNTTQKNLQPYMQTGQYANTALQNLTGLGPGVGGYDNIAYQNALTAYRNGGGGSNTSGANGTPSSRTSASSPNGAVVVAMQDNGHNEPSYILSDGRVVSRNDLYNATGREPHIGSVYTTDNSLNSINNLKGNPTFVGPGSAGFDASGNSISGSDSGGREPQLTDFPMGGGGSNPLTSPLLKPIVMDQETLSKTPGYQFQLTQGLKGVQNAAAARGLGVSGAALKGAAQYATGLANENYQTQFQNALTNQTNQFNRIFDISQAGQNAAAGLGGIGQVTAAGIAGNQVGAGNAQAAGIMSGANALSGGIQNAASSYYGNNLLQGMYGGSGVATNPSADIYASINNPANAGIF